MNVSFSHLFIQYSVTRKIVNRKIDPTMQVIINARLQDQPLRQTISATELFGYWELLLPDQTRSGLSTKEAEALWTGFKIPGTDLSLLSLDEILERADAIAQQEEEDPMTQHYGGMSSII